jgi:hypothetical protein
MVGRGPPYGAVATSPRGFTVNGGMATVGLGPPYGGGDILRGSR